MMALELFELYTFQERQKKQHKNKIQQSFFNNIVLDWDDFVSSHTPNDEREKLRK